MKTKKPLFLLLINVIIGTFLFSGCTRIMETYGNITNRTPVEVPIPVFAVNIIPASEGPIQDYISLSGNIVASSSVDTFSDVAGRVSRVYVSVGARVNRGDPIAEIDRSVPGMEFMPSIVRAPVGGTILALPAQVGMTISQAVPLARIGGASLEVQLFVAERFISRISLNQPCEITLDAWPGEVFRGVITNISPTVDVASRTMEIRVRVDNIDNRLRAGMFARVNIITEHKENIVKIPIGGLISRFGEQFVYVIDYSDPEIPVAKRRDIRTGISIDGVVEIADGLLPAEEVVVRGQSLLEDGSRVNIIERYSPLN